MLANLPADVTLIRVRGRRKSWPVPIIWTKLGFVVAGTIKPNKHPSHVADPATIETDIRCLCETNPTY